MEIDALSFGFTEDKFAGFLRKKLENQGIHPEVIKLVVDNCDALVKLEYDNMEILPHFLFDAKEITESTAIKINKLQKHLQPREVLQWQSEGNWIGSPFKIEG